MDGVYIEKERPQALRNLGHALAEASLIILARVMAYAAAAICSLLAGVVWPRAE